MRENKKGFTLIELLAVIVILAIIALIATPIILNLINTARKGSFARSAEGVVKASKLFYTSSLLEFIDNENISFTCDGEKCISSKVDGNGNPIELDVDGNTGVGTVRIYKDGGIFISLNYGQYCAQKTIEQASPILSQGECSEIVANRPTGLLLSTSLPELGKIIVVGKVDNFDDEIKSYEFSIDGENYFSNDDEQNRNMYIFENLDLGHEYTVTMKVTNKKDESESITKEVKTLTVEMPTYSINPSGDVWAVSKTVTIDYPNIDTNIYKKVYKLDDAEYIEYTEPIDVKVNGNIVVDIQKKETNQTILNSTLVINVNNIDSSAPINVDFEYEQTETGVQITATASDEESGIYGYQFSIDDGVNYTDIQTSSKYEFNNLVSGNTYKLKVKAINNTYTNSGIKDNNSLESEVKDFKITKVVKFVIAEAVGSASTGLDENGSIWVWGWNPYGYLGTQDSTKFLTPYKLNINTTFEKVSKGSSHTLALDKDGKIWGWGANVSGQLGTVSPSEKLTPSKIVSTTTFNNLTFTDIFAKYSNSFAIDNYGRVWVWGQNTCGTLGAGSDSEVKSPAMLNAITTKIKNISSSSSHTLVLDENGQIWSWGCNSSGQLGDATTAYHFYPQKLNITTKFIDIAVGNSYSIILDEDGALWAVGDNRYGQLGNGKTATLYKLTKIVSTHNFVKVYAIGYSSYALDSDGHLWSWGSNSSGQLGNGTKDDSLELTQIDIDKRIIEFNPTGSGGIAIDEEHNMWVWGKNSDGQLGDNSTTESLIPKKIIVTE